MLSDQTTGRRPLGARLLELAQHPDHVLMVQGSRVVTVDEALQRATALASAITEREPDAGGPLVVVGSRSPETVISVLATLLAGRGFVILEADQPDARVNEVIDRVGSGLMVVADGSLAEGRHFVVNALPLDDRATTIPTDAFSTPDPKSPAYVVFTSGSTGRPKGVVLSHADAEAWCDDRAEQIDERGWSVFPCHSPLSYAAGLNPILAALEGTRIDLLDGGLHGPFAIAEWILDRQFAGIELVPSLAHAIARAATRRMESLQLVSTVGEPMDWDTIEVLRQSASPELTVEVRYASSEALLVMRTFVGPEDPIGTGVVPLGVPRSGRRVQLEPVGGEPGAPAEMVVYGGAMAGGYWDDDELTRARFGVTDDGVRFYRTGDLAEVDPDGVYHFRGRVDDLVKIRGLLVEPAEAERQLMRVEGITSASVLVHESGLRGARLVGHVVVAPGSDLTPHEVRRRLGEHLPGHVIPSMLVRHDALPLTERGKVDRAALRADPLVPWRATPLLPPRDLFEMAAVSVVSELLEQPGVSRDDDLFDLGADSLMLQELAARLSDRFGVDVSIASVVSHPRIDRLAGAVRRSEREAGADDIIVLNPDGSQHPLVVLAGAAGTAVAFRPLADALGPDHPVWVVHQQGVLRGGRTDRSIEAWAARAREMLAARGLAAPYLLAGHSVGGLVAYELAQQYQRSGEQVALLALLDTSRPQRGNGHLAHVDSEPHVRTPRQWISWFVRGAGNRALRPARRLAVRTHPPRSLEEYMVLLRAAVRLGASYRPEPLELDQPMLVVHVSRPVIVQQWAELTTVDAIEASGDHLTMLESGNIAAVSTALQARIDGGSLTP
jgi:acyl-coenzyme A synthetase/AMP-(fatty) acid ligase/thioesterase domain-containing protein/acyl carrier protein